MRNDIIELFTDIDDDLIAGAMPEAQRPVELKADTRRFSWGKFAAAAACLTVVAVGGAFALKAVSGRGGLVSSENAGSADPAVIDVPMPAGADYPEDAIYQYTGDFSELELCPYACVDRECYQSFDELVDNSDLIVVGTFVDNARQNRPTDRLSYQSSLGASYNKLRVEKVFYGNAEVGSEIVIGDKHFVTDGKLMYVSGDSLTPMIKGEQWVYFLGKVSPEYGNYYYPLYTEGRYPVPGNENSFVLTDNHYNDEIYADVKKMLGDICKVENDDHEDQQVRKEFTMPEFPGDKFIRKKEEMLVLHGGETERFLYGAPAITSVYLTDLNGDGKRELVNLCWNGASGLSANQLMVYDYANSKYYTLKTDTEKLITNDLEIRDNVLYVLTYPIHDDSKAISDEPLTFDMLVPVTRCGLD